MDEETKSALKEVNRLILMMAPAPIHISQATIDALVTGNTPIAPGACIWEWDSRTPAHYPTATGMKAIDPPSKAAQERFAAIQEKALAPLMELEDRLLSEMRTIGVVGSADLNIVSVEASHTPFETDAPQAQDIAGWRGNLTEGFEPIRAPAPSPEDQAIHRAISQMRTEPHGNRMGAAQWIEEE